MFKIKSITFLALLVAMFVSTFQSQAAYAGELNNLGSEEQVAVVAYSTPIQKDQNNLAGDSSGSKLETLINCGVKAAEEGNFEDAVNFFADAGKLIPTK